MRRIDARDLARRAISLIESNADEKISSLDVAKECLEHGESYIAVDIALGISNKRGIVWPNDLISDLVEFREFNEIDDGLEELTEEQEKLKRAK